MTTQTTLEAYGFARRKRRRAAAIADDDKDVVQALEEDLEEWRKLQEVVDYLEEQEILEQEIKSRKLEEELDEEESELWRELSREEKEEVKRGKEEVAYYERLREEKKI